MYYARYFRTRRSLFVFLMTRFFCITLPKHIWFELRSLLRLECCVRQPQRFVSPLLGQSCALWVVLNRVVLNSECPESKILYPILLNMTVFGDQVLDYNYSRWSRRVDMIEGDLKEGKFVIFFAVPCNEETETYSGRLIDNYDHFYVSFVADFPV